MIINAARAGSVLNSEREFRGLSSWRSSALASLALVGFAMLFQVSVTAQQLRFGTNAVSPGQVIAFGAPLNVRGRTEAGRLKLAAHSAQGAFVLPVTFTNLSRPCPLLILSVPSGASAIDWMSTVTNNALKAGWAVLAADRPRVPADNDTIQFGWAMLSSVLDQFARTWPQVRQWPVACGGFSGGAKRSAAVAAALSHDGWHVIGVFMGGCNEDFATQGLQLFQPGESFKRVPFFLSNGASDPIANPRQAAMVAESMRRSGFTRLRLETYEGGHRQHNEHLELALEWFRLDGSTVPLKK